MWIDRIQGDVFIRLGIFATLIMGIIMEDKSESCRNRENHKTLNKPQEIKAMSCRYMYKTKFEFSIRIWRESVMKFIKSVQIRNGKSSPSVPRQYTAY